MDTRRQVVLCHLWDAKGWNAGQAESLQEQAAMDRDLSENIVLGFYLGNGSVTRDSEFLYLVPYETLLQLPWTAIEP